MGSRELIESLWESAREKAKGYHTKAGEEARKYEEEILAEKEALRSKYEHEVLIAAEAEASSIVAKARRTAMRERLLMEKEIAGRLLDRSQKALSSLRTHYRKAVFLSLANELPDLQWGEVRINSADRTLADGLFPGAVIVDDDETVTGGLRAMTKDGTIEVINTFEKRLEGLWDTLLPRMMNEVRSRLTDDESA